MKKSKSVLALNGFFSKFLGKALAQGAKRRKTRLSKGFSEQPGEYFRIAGDGAQVQYTNSISRYFGSGQLASETFFSMESTTTRRSAMAARISS